MYYTYTSSCTSDPSGYDACTIRSLRRDNEILTGRNRNLEKANDYLTKEIAELRDQLRNQSDYVRELRRETRKAKRLKTALNDFMGPEATNTPDRPLQRGQCISPWNCL